MQNNRQYMYQAKHFDSRQKNNRNLNEPSVVDSSDAKINREK